MGWTCIEYENASDAMHVRYNTTTHMYGVYPTMSHACVCSAGYFNLFTEFQLELGVG